MCGSPRGCRLPERAQVGRGGCALGLEAGFEARLPLDVLDGLIQVAGRCRRPANRPAVAAPPQRRHSGCRAAPSPPPAAAYSRHSYTDNVQQEEWLQGCSICIRDAESTWWTHAMQIHARRSYTWRRVAAHQRAPTGARTPEAPHALPASVRSSAASCPMLASPSAAASLSTQGSSWRKAALASGPTTSGRDCLSQGLGRQAGGRKHASSSAAGGSSAWPARRCRGSGWPRCRGAGAGAGGGGCPERPCTTAASQSSGPAGPPGAADFHWSTSLPFEGIRRRM